MGKREDDFLKPGELSKHWQLSKRTIRQYLADGAITPLRHRGRVFVPWNQIWDQEAGRQPPRGREAAWRQPLLTVEEAAVLTGYSPDYVYTLAARGMIPCRRIFTNLRFAEHELRAWMRSPAGAMPAA